MVADQILEQWKYGFCGKQTRDCLLFLYPKSGKEKIIYGLKVDSAKFLEGRYLNYGSTMKETCTDFTRQLSAD